MNRAVVLSDSQNVLWWIHGHSRDFKLFFLLTGLGRFRQVQIRSSGDIYQPV